MANATTMRGWTPRLVEAGVMLALLALLHVTKWLVLAPALRWTLVGVIVATAAVPARLAGWASGVGFLAVGGVAYFVYGSGLVGLLCGVFGAWRLAEAWRNARG